MAPSKFTDAHGDLGQHAAVLKSGHRQTWIVCLLLAVLAFAAYWPALNCGFVQLDDPEYVVANPHIQHGLTWPMAVWAFRSGYAANWHPLTWLSHALDVELFGLNPRGHHAASIAWHSGNAVLLFLVLTSLTGARWRSAAVAALFAVHPLHVESVAWVAERKDVLSTFFWLLSVWAYGRYASDAMAGRANLKAYGVSLACFALGLMAKPMVVTLPFVLLLLDFWPLARFSSQSNKMISRLLREKLPFFLLSIASSLITFLVQRHAGVMSSLTKIPAGARLDNLPVAYARYLLRIVCPIHLAAFYPHPRFWPVWEVAVSAAALVVLTVWVVRQHRPRPYLAVGWFWFLGMLIPVIGLVQVGNQSMADRYAYLPMVGILIMIVWGGNELLSAQPRLKAIGPSSCAVAVALCGLLTARQAGFWHDTVTLFVHTSEITADNYEAFYNLGLYWQHHGEPARAIEYYQKSIDIKGDYAPAHNNLGYLLLAGGQAGQAVKEFSAALEAQPVYPEAAYNLGRAYMTNREPDRAIASFSRALAMDPKVPDINYSLGEVLLQQGQLDRAREYLERALQLRPNFPMAQYKLANALLQQGWVAQAVNNYENVLRLRPDFVPACNNFAWLLATCPDPQFRHGRQALALAEHASQLTGNRDPLILGTLAAAQAESGRFAAAAATAATARRLALAQTNAALANIIDMQERQYRQQLPWRDTGQPVKNAGP